MSFPKNNAHTDARYRVLRDSVLLGAMTRAGEQHQQITPEAAAHLGYVVDALQKVCEVVLEGEVQIQREPDKADFVRTLYAAKVTLIINAIGLLDGRTER